jgi:hypothetical protein
MLLAIAGGVLAFADFFVPNQELDALGRVLLEGVTILAAFALLLGVLNLLGTHARKVAQDRTGRGYSLTLCLALVITLAVGLFSGGGGALRWLFEYVYAPLQATLTALLAFFLVSAAYRAFRLRSGHAVILVIASLLMLLAQLPFAGALSPYLPAVRDWMLAVPVTAAMRGILLGVALGSISTALRVLLAVDRPYLGE